MKIPIEPKPYHDEILSSWLIRSSIANGSEPSSWASGIWIEYRAWTRDIDRHLPTDKINKISQITSLTKEQIRAMTLEPLVENITNEKPLNDKKGWPFVIPTGFRGGTKTNGTHFCSTCLSKPDFYIKKHWRLAWNTACPIHNQLLTLRCEKCYHVFSPYLIDYKNTKVHICTNCGYDLRDSNVVKADKEIIIFQETLNDAAFNNTIDNSIPLLEHSAHELFLTLRTILALFRTINRLPRHHDIFAKLDIPLFSFSSSSNKELFEAMDIKDRGSLLLAASRLLKLNIEEIKDMLQKSNITYKSFTDNISAQSKTIEYLSKDLHINKKKSHTNTYKEIKPRSKEEVEKLMDEIRPYI